MNDPSQEPWEDDLLRHQRFLLRLATRLAGAEVEAEDLVQDAFARALERPPRRVQAGAGDGSLRAWLATVLRRSAGRSARGARRRADREALVASDAAREEHAAVDARLDAHAELLALLRDLPEGERQVLFLRYSEDLAPPAIAARLDVPLETVRTRLRRGRERLRARLDARYGGRATWAALLLPISSSLHPSIPGTAPAPTSSAGPASTSAASAATQIGAGVLVGTTAKILVGAAACAAAFFLFVDRRAEPLQRDTALTPERTVRDAEPERPDELLAAAAAPARSEAGVDAPAVRIDPLRLGLSTEKPAETPPPPHAEWPLIVRAEGAPAAGAAIRVAARLDAFGRYDASPVEGVLDGNNEVRLDVGAHLADLLAHADGARAEELIVTLDHPGLVPAEASLLLPDPLDLMHPPDEPLVVVVRVERASVVIGRVVDDAHEPLEGETFVQAHARRADGIEPDARGSIEPGEDGAFRLRVDGQGPFALLAVGVRLRPGTALPVLARGGVVDVGDVVVSRGVAIDGRAVDLAGAPRENASVFAMLLGEPTLIDLARFSFELPGTVAWCAGAFELFANEAKTAADGAFRIEGLGPRRYQLDTMAPLVDVPFPLADKLEVTAPATVEVRPQAAELRLSVRFPGGPPRDGAALWTRGDGEKRVDMPVWSYLRNEEDIAIAADVVFETIEGSPSFGARSGDPPSDLPPGEPFVRRFALPPNEHIGFALHVDGCAPVELAFDMPGAGGVVAREVVLEPDRAAARLVLVLKGARVEDGTPFVAVLRSAAGERDRSLKAAGRELVLDDLDPGPLSIVLSAGEDRFAPQDHLRDVPLDLVLAPGEERRVDVELERGGTLILAAVDEDGTRLEADCTVRNAAGDALDVVFVARIPDGRVAGYNHLFSGGPSHAVPELAPGRYRVEVHAEGRRDEAIDVAIEVGATTERSIVLHAAD